MPETGEPGAAPHHAASRAEGGFPRRASIDAAGRVEGTAGRIEELAQENKSLVQNLADAVNKLVDAGRLAAGPDLQPERVNEFCTRAIVCADEITRLARQLRDDLGAGR